MKRDWYNTFVKKVEELWIRDKCYIKEKYWRVDITPYWVPDGMFDKLMEIERESEECCMKCCKKCKQYWTETWWIEHFCFKHYISFMVKYYIRKFYYIIKYKWLKIK